MTDHRGLNESSVTRSCTFLTLAPFLVVDFVYSTDSDEWWRSENTKKYYCMYRNLWTKVDHPAKYPRFARLSDVIMYTSTTGFTPWLKCKRITAGIESLVEVSKDATIRILFLILSE
jgi:hypothetical protein